MPVEKGGREQPLTGRTKHALVLFSGRILHLYSRIRRWWSLKEVSEKRADKGFWLLFPLLILGVTLLVSFALTIFGGDTLVMSGDSETRRALFTTMAQVLGAILAIVFAVILVLLDIVERTYSDPLLVRLYLSHRNIILFPSTYIWAIIIAMLATARMSGGDSFPTWFVTGGFFFGMLALFSLYRFVWTTLKFLQPREMLTLLSRMAVDTWRTLR